MTAQAVAGALAGALLVLLIFYAWLWHAARSQVASARDAHQAAEAALKREREDYLGRLAELDRQLRARSADVAALQVRVDAAEGRHATLSRELESRRLGPIREGELVALTTPEGATIRGTVRQTFDNGAVLLGAAVVLDEVVGRGGQPDVVERPAGDVSVPAHAWAQKIPSSPAEE